jgi:hypothetical protein
MINNMNLRLWIILSVLISFYSCKKDNSNNKSPSGDYINIAQNGNFYIDKVNDVGKSFIDLDSLSINISSVNINVNIGLVKMPDSLIFSQEALPINALNYEWSIYFDMDNSNSITKGDISFSIMRYKFKDSLIVTYNILDGTQKNLWLNYGQGDTTIVDLERYTSLKGNSIYFSIPKSIDSSLKSINNNTNFFFKAYFNDGNNKYYDYYPDRK